MGTDPMPADPMPADPMLADPMPADPMLAAYLSGADRPCPLCGYNLRDLVGNRCPECGDELALRLALAEPRQRAQIAGLVGLSAGAGLSGLMLVFLALVTLFLRQGGGADRAFVIVTGGGLLVEGLAVAAWLRAWPRIRRASGTVRWALVATCWMLTLANIVVFSFTLRD